MMKHNDRLYESTKLIKLKKETLEEPFSYLCSWINLEYDLDVINVSLDFFNPTNTIRLNIISEHRKSLERFRQTGDGKWESMVSGEILRKCSDLLSKSRSNIRIRDENGIGKIVEKLDVNRIAVVFSDFESAVLSEANSTISQSEIEQLLIEIDCEFLWTISRFFGNATVFLYTDRQLEKYFDDRLREKCRSLYFKLLKRYDQCQCIEYDSFEIGFDSKENFDHNYQSNWHLYYR